LSGNTGIKMKNQKRRKPNFNSKNTTKGQKTKLPYGTLRGGDWVAKIQTKEKRGKNPLVPRG